MDWHPTVHYFDTLNQILFITGDMEKIAFIFYKNDDTYTLLKRIRVDKEHYRCGVLVTDRRAASERADNLILIAMVDYNNSKKTGKLVKFTPKESDQD